MGKLESDLRAILARHSRLPSGAIKSVDHARARIGPKSSTPSLYTDVSGELRSGELFFIELDVTTNPAYSVSKYWPLLEATHRQKSPPRIRLLVFWSRTKTGFSYDIAALADFIARRYRMLYPGRFRYERIEVRDKEAMVRKVDEIAATALNFLRMG